jgi:hypothetical protein
VFATNDPIMSACTIAQNTDGEIRDLMNDFEDAVIAKIVGVVQGDAGARPISDDIPALVRTLTATTAMTLSHDAAFVGRDDDPQRAMAILERMWLSALWGGDNLPV